MRLVLLSPSVLIGLTLVPSARACGSASPSCGPAVVVFPAYTPEGLRIGTLEARVRPIPRPERSRFTGEPLTVMYNSPGSRPGAIDPDLVLVPLPRVARSQTQAVYPRGY